MITIHYFARLKEITGKDRETLEKSGMKVNELIVWAEDTYHGFSKLFVHVAINEEYANPDDVIFSGDVVAFIPPVSGG